MIYESYDLPKESPTVVLFFTADEYIRFLGDTKGYLTKEHSFIPPEQYKYADELRKDKRFGIYPIGVIDDVEIAFLHYHSEQEAREKRNVDADDSIGKGWLSNSMIRMDVPRNM